ncbi:hypothetical protein CB0940_07794 [Cercospora beticola]|uniref:Uncharacterized protein n=1 Tax=Cercospora beticola TaxID=122368 RepID=A0A2G5H8C8_CERBT|nr:hypothetical protein CB0940_07794 [Cercospora beticola]PIA88781.1 hypothetical protein CB0940_07794 [Cercospora beticola]WPB03762.1 hypothetical protein RHO25_008406 [Cercospora beticola]CAK1357473.1 unnamed protein product [Cercospora beticola]
MAPAQIREQKANKKQKNKAKSRIVVLHFRHPERLAELTQRLLETSETDTENEEKTQRFPPPFPYIDNVALAIHTQDLSHLDTIPADKQTDLVSFLEQISRELQFRLRRNIKFLHEHAMQFDEETTKAVVEKWGELEEYDDLGSDLMALEYCREETRREYVEVLFRQCGEQRGWVREVERCIWEHSWGVWGVSEEEVWSEEKGRIVERLVRSEEEGGEEDEGIREVVEELVRGWEVDEDGV